MFQFILPHSFLRDYIYGYIVLESATEDNLPQFELLSLPDLMNGLYFSFNDAVAGIVNNKKEKMSSIPNISVAGLYTTPTQFQLGVDYKVIMVLFKPGMMNHFLGHESGDFTNVFVSLDDILGRKVQFVEEQLREAKTIQKRIELIETFIVGQLREHQENHQIQELLTSIYDYRGNLNIERIAKEKKLSFHTVNRVFKRKLGVSPKLYARIVRFQHALNYMDFMDPRWLDKTLDLGFFDQAHFINDFKQLSGYSPTEYLEQQAPLTVQQLLLKMYRRVLDY